MMTPGELLANAARWLEDFCWLEEVLGRHAEFRFAPVRGKFRRTRGVRPARRAAALAREVVNLDQDDPIRDIFRLLEDNGVKVYAPSIASEGFFGFSLAEGGGGPAVVVNTWDRVAVERWIFTAAHELGHLLMHHEEAHDVSKTDEDKQEDAEADVFAAHLLMPDAAFDLQWFEARGLDLIDRVFKLKRIFRVSYRTVLGRLASKSTTDPTKIWRRFQRDYRARTAKTQAREDEPDQLLPAELRTGRPPDRSTEEPESLLAHDFVGDRLSRLVREAIEKEVITMSRGAEILRMSPEDMRALAISWAVR